MRLSVLQGIPDRLPTPTRVVETLQGLLYFLNPKESLWGHTRSAQHLVGCIGQHPITPLVHE
ncbi:MAG: hypothetical protein DDT35_01453 [Firmicutes bacterium]|nr:hypothetical protein [Bacillota bacterium]